MQWLETCLAVDCCVKTSYHLLHDRKKCHIFAEPPDTPVLQRLQRMTSTGLAKGTPLKGTDEKKEKESNKREKKSLKKVKSVKQGIAQRLGQKLCGRGEVCGTDAKSQHLIPRARLRASQHHPGHHTEAPHASSRCKVLPTCLPQIGDSLFYDLPRMRLDGGARAFRRRWGYELTPPPTLVEEENEDDPYTIPNDDDPDDNLSYTETRSLRDDYLYSSSQGKVGVRALCAVLLCFRNHRRRQRVK
ncbi:uncharacterized protein LOC121870036 [Homarus americanus]|uniref:Uncharacterized protein n=1 Tax=Homarus americanus TaxID=6706 RepID=A0A8J5JY83_HOMAM|nr:uncharacterized protein LOC121870036 [Homarus americanus]KAG7166047.1 hypothetical protein Hamer_G011988 [Homarus americanus]